MTIVLGLVVAIVLGIAGAAIYLRGVDVGRENALRELQARWADEEPTLYLKIATKGDKPNDDAGKGD